MKYYVLITILFFITYFIRSSFIVFGHRIHLSENIKLGLSFLVVSILPAMIFPSILLEYDSSLFINERLVAAIAAIVISLKTKSIMATMFGGFGVLMLMHQF